MSYRKFTDRSGAAWQVKDDSLNRWTFDPLPGNPSRPRTVTPPSYTDDPFEMSEGELQHLFDKARAASRPGKAAWPFKDEPPEGA